MSQTTIVVQGIVTADGTLELAGKLDLPPGRVQVVIQALPELSGDSLIQRLEAIWAGQRARGHIPRSAEEVEAERQVMGQEWDERMAEIARIQDEAEQLRVRRTQG